MVEKRTKRKPKKRKASRQGDLPHVNICQRCHSELNPTEPLLCGAACTVLYEEEKGRK